MDNGRPSYVAFTDYFDDGIALMECAAGYKTAVVMPSQKFQMLLDSGASALLEGFTLEACASFAAALERFYEFSLRVAFAGRQQSGDLYNKMFSEMARQSERQLGAFMLLHALEFGSAYKPKDTIARFRNSVIHKGVIPTGADAHEFCSEVYETIRKLFNTVHAKYADSIGSVVREENFRRQTAVSKGTRVATSTGGNLFSILEGTESASFSEALDGFRKQRTTISEMMASYSSSRSVFPSSPLENGVSDL
jgi:hypothetical protein